MVKGGGLKYFVGILLRHKTFLQKEVNMYLKQGNYRMADRSHAKLEDVDKQVMLYNTRIKELRQTKGR